MPQKKYLVTLTTEERDRLTGLVSAGKRSALTITRARILLKADQADGGPAWDDARIADALDCGTRTVERVRQRFVERGPEAALILSALLCRDREGIGRLAGHAEVAGVKLCPHVLARLAGQCQFKVMDRGRPVHRHGPDHAALDQVD